MRVLLQRVSSASVTVDGAKVSDITDGLLALIGIRDTDTQSEVDWMVRKMLDLRVFEDSEGKMNLSVRDIGGSVLAVSQFTLYGDARKGNRPNFMAAARPEVAERLYNEFVSRLRDEIGESRVGTGVFQAMMQVELVNSGPVTILLERDASDSAIQK